MGLSYFYHATTKEDYTKILKEGLLPRVGDNSKSIGETESRIYLCDYEDLAWWGKLLGKDIALKVAVDEEQLTEFAYGLYKEFFCETPINNANISQIEMPTISPNCMRNLCKSYIENISYLCRTLSVGKQNLDIEFLIQECNGYMPALRVLDYTLLSDEEKIEALKECNYSFCDTNKNTNKRIWELLIEQPEDILTKYREELYTYILTNFKNCLYVDTGSWGV